jgi:anti-sigma B factor antagonist
MNPNIKIIQPSGILDGTTAQEFRQQIKSLAEKQVSIILIDFKDVKFMDSSGLGALILSLKTVRSAGIKMVLCSINDQIRMLFELTSMDRVFEIYPSREEFEKTLMSSEN